LGGERAARENRYFQRGVNYRSLCARCNSELLGARYDPVLIEFTRQIDRFISQRLYLPLEILTQPNKFVRSVVGHLVAHGLQLHQAGSFFSDMSRYFLNERAVLPNAYRMHCWLYPYNDQFVSQCNARLTHPGGDFILQSILKFYPVAFTLMQGGAPEVRSGLTRLDPLLSIDINTQAIIEITLSALPPKRWPEAPGPDEAVMHTPLSLGAIRE